MRFIFILALVTAMAGLSACGGGNKTNEQETAGQTGEQNMAQGEQAGGTQGEAAGAGSTQAAAGGEEQGSMNPIVERSMNKDPGPADEVAVMKTNMGDITLRLFPQQAPLAVANFKGLAAKGYYDGGTFHRVIDGFMIQGGDPTGTGRGGESLWGGTFKDEFSPELRFNRPGLLAMANRGPNTNGSQFFITVAPTPHLNDKHTIFGEVMEGMDVVNAIAKVPTGPGNKPEKPVVIEGITIKKQGD